MKKLLGIFAIAVLAMGISTSALAETCQSERSYIIKDATGVPKVDMTFTENWGVSCQDQYLLFWLTLENLGPQRESIRQVFPNAFPAQ